MIIIDIAEKYARYRDEMSRFSAVFRDFSVVFRVAFTDYRESSKKKKNPGPLQSTDFLKDRVCCGVEIGTVLPAENLFTEYKK